MVLQNRNNPVAIYKTDALVLIEKNNNNKKHAYALQSLGSVKFCIYIYIFFN